MAKYTGTVTKIVDGDTIHVKDDFGNKQIIRLFGIDTPEKRQAFGMEAKAFMASIAENKRVSVDTVNLGKYNRISAIVTVNNQCIAEQLLKAGLAFASGTNHRLANHYFALQEQASVKQIGMWKNGKPQNPTLFRRSMNKSVYRNNPLFTKTKKSHNHSAYNIQKPLLQSLQDLVLDGYYNIKERVNFSFFKNIKDSLISKLKKNNNLITKSSSTPISHLDEKHFLDDIDGNVLLKRYIKTKDKKDTQNISINKENVVKSVETDEKKQAVDFKDSKDQQKNIDGNILLNRINSRKRSNI